MTPAVFVAGHAGMLGHVVAAVFSTRGYIVRTSSARYGGEPQDPLVEEIRSSDCSLVVNCLGRIHQKPHSLADLYLCNVLFPLHLQTCLRPDQHLFHASSDCVFSGQSGHYRVGDKTDAMDSYGFSKRLAETGICAPKVTIIRTSVVGPERGTSFSLLSWFLSQPSDAIIPGYTNHLWNGITTLEWATLAEELWQQQRKGVPLPRLIQPSCPATVSKYELLGLFRDCFSTDHRIRPVVAPQRRDMSLVPTILRAPLREQLLRLAAFVAGS